MDGEHIEMIISGWSSTELREKALTELGNMREELYVLRQLASGLTKRVPDVVESEASSEISTASEVSASEADSTPATTQVM